MRHSLFPLLAISVFTAAACSSESTSPTTSTSTVDGGSVETMDGSASVADGATGDGGVSTDTDAESDCSNLMLNDVPTATVDALFHSLGIWQADQQVGSGGSHTPLMGCDAAFAYRIGPEVIVGDAYKFVECKLKRGDIIELSAGPYKVPMGGCADFACTGKLGLLWSSETGGSVYQLDDNGKPKGVSVLSFRLGANGINKELLVNNAGGPSGTGYIQRPGDATALKCH